ncbi:4Fe-4S dicluster domain-containing protein [Aurantiacibacter sediminis]|uniref:4Fe-4S dicluster domain-containing protein n=1 Tax=Aurantiacibacter sediminis TaxID=2793064 RepID=A0ABS0N6J5_9SPHN|nr:4Fe-4S dicluster domain-containing protein [Aurantiacibacter sediminis]MBH5323454.1 4Fe-4S dicluster domain-containing protein [Aurantiacibacter sediminis]
MPEISLPDDARAKAAAQTSDKTGKQLAFVIDLKRCIGCDTCVIACKVEHVMENGKSRLQVYDTDSDPVFEQPRGVFPNLQQYWVPSMCHHCEDAPCVTVCPTTALWHNDENGMVELTKDKCVGCRRCEEVCPYNALSFSDDVGTANKCDMCKHRLEEGLVPSCQLVCPTRAIYHGDIHDPDSKVAQILATRETRVLNEHTGAKPQIYYTEP